MSEFLVYAWKNRWEFFAVWWVLYWVFHLIPLIGTITGPSEVGVYDVIEALLCVAIVPVFIGYHLGQGPIPEPETATGTDVGTKTGK